MCKKFFLDRLIDIFSRGGVMHVEQESQESKKLFGVKQLFDDDIQIQKIKYF
jgi:hypothetical protein